MIELSASMMCANYECLRDEVARLEEAGVDSFHIDLMDGIFVPNLGMGLQDLECIERLTEKPLEIHLMVENVPAYLRVLQGHRIRKIYFHPEPDPHPFQTIQTILDMGIEPGIALDPGTSIESVRELFHVARSVLALAVTPGFAGKPYWPFVGDKVRRLIQLKDQNQLKVYWDGSCTWERLETFSRAGVDGFVMASNVLFRQNDSYANLVARARKLTSQEKQES